MTIVGTIHKNKHFLTPEFQSSKGESQKTQFLFKDKVTLVKYNPKKDKSVILLSTLHRDNAIDDETNKPEIITFYNSTKGGVDSLDQIVRFFSTKHKTRRWPM